MRTTLTIEPDVAARLDRVVKRRKSSLKRVVNDALREGLDRMESDAKPSEPFVVKPFPNMELLVDVTSTGELMAEWELEDFLEKQKKLLDDSR